MVFFYVLLYNVFENEDKNMALLSDYKITETEITDTFGYDVRDKIQDEDGSVVKKLIDRSYRFLVNGMYRLNHDVSEDDDFVVLLDNASKIDAFKEAQYQTIRNIIELGDVNPIDSIVENILRNRAKISNMNGWQK